MSQVTQETAHGRPTLALVMWGDLFEDFHDTIGVSLEDFRTTLSGGWLFGYTEALASAGVRTALVTVSARVDEVTRFTHEPSRTQVVVLPAPRRHRWLRSLVSRLPRRKAFSSTLSYLSIPVFALRRTVRTEGARALLTQEYEHARFDVLVLLGALWRLPVFATFQGGDKPASKLERPLRPFAVRRSAGLIIGSSRERARVEAVYGVPAARIAPIPNALDVRSHHLMDRSIARERLGIDPRDRVVEWHGRVTVRRKGLDVLCDAWDIVCRDRDHVLLLLVGTGPDADQFRSLLDALPAGTVRWRDEYVADRDELLPYPSAADVYVLP
ncbi:MAG: glycosyltransferase family 4 protein, partial [Euzebyales bacterium]|nr:glycosyltransferase family 4 protein [Euzebyales bacterium]